MKRLLSLKRNEKGVIMIETLITFLIAILLMFFLLAVFSLLFQRWNIQTVANETAAKVAQSYRFENADSDGYVLPEDIALVREYRYLWKSSDLKNAAEEKAELYALERLKNTTFSKTVDEPKVTVEIEKDSLARRHAKVVIEGSYTALFGEIFGFFGFESVTTYEAVAYAECLDMIDYINTTDFVAGHADFGVFDSKLVGLIDSVMGLFDNLLGGDDS